MRNGSGCNLYLLVRKCGLAVCCRAGQQRTLDYLIIDTPQLFKNEEITLNKSSGAQKNALFYCVVLKLLTYLVSVIVDVPTICNCSRT